MGKYSIIKKDVKEIKSGEYTFVVDIAKSDPNSINDKNVDRNWDIVFESAISGKALLRIREKSEKNVFYNPYGIGKHLYDLDRESGRQSFINNNKTKDKNDYFIIIYCDLEVDGETGDIIKTSDNYREIDRIVYFILNNLN